MTRYEKALKLKDKDFKQRIGVQKTTFDEMIEVLCVAYAEKHKRRGRHAKLSMEDQLFMSLKYWRQYIAQKELAFEFEVGEATAHDRSFGLRIHLLKAENSVCPVKKHFVKMRILKLCWLM